MKGVRYGRLASASRCSSRSVDCTERLKVLGASVLAALYSVGARADVSPTQPLSAACQAAYNGIYSRMQNDIAGCAADPSCNESFHIGTDINPYVITYNEYVDVFNNGGSTESIQNR